MLLPLLVSALGMLPLSSHVTLRAAPAAVAPSAWTAREMQCDDGSSGGTLVQRVDAYYGNHFHNACAGARLQGVTFAHYGYGLAGPYTYRLHVLDAACREIGVTPVQSVPPTTDTPAVADVDLSGYGWCVPSEFFLLLEPLRCADGLAGDDCFPALLVDATTDSRGSEHCAALAAPAVSGRECLQAQSVDGRFFDFRLRARVDCGQPGCTTAIVSTPWSLVKQLYRNPR